MTCYFVSSLSVGHSTDNGQDRMSGNQGLRFLRPYLCKDLKPASRSAYVRFYATTVQSRAAHRQCVQNQILKEFHAVYRSLHTEAARHGRKSKATDLKEADIDHTNAVNEAQILGAALEHRVQELKAAHALVYPRIKSDKRAISCAEYKQRFANLGFGETHEGGSVVIRGRLHSVRISGSKLVFLDVVQDGHRVQAVCNFSKLEAKGVTLETFRKFYHIFRRGDIICEFCIY